MYQTNKVFAICFDGLYKKLDYNLINPSIFRQKNINELRYLYKNM